GVGTARLHARCCSAVGSAGRSSSGWGEHDERSWSREDYSGERYFPSRYEEPDPFEDHNDPADDSEEPATEPGLKGWAQAGSAGPRGAALCLPRRPAEASRGRAVSLGPAA